MIPAFLADRENRKRKQIDNHIGVGTNMDFDPRDEDDFEEDDEIVWETKGSNPPPQPTPMEEAQAQMELERQRNELAQQQAERDRQAAAAEKQAKIDRARGLQSQAYNNALGYGDLQSRARGFDTGLTSRYGLEDLFRAGVDNARLGIAEDDLNPGAAYNTATIYNDALNTARGTYRGDLTKQLNALAPEDYAYNIFQDTADDEILNEILNTGRSDAMAQLDAAKARGQLNDVGYSRALKDINSQGQRAMSDLQGLGGGVLSGYRKQLDALRTGQLDRISSADFNNPLNFDSFGNRLKQTQTDLMGRLQGDIFKATDGQTFFDPSKAITGAGALQGFYNPVSTGQGTKVGAGNTGANPLLNAFTDDEKKKSASGNEVF